MARALSVALRDCARIRHRLRPACAHARVYESERAPACARVGTRAYVCVCECACVRMRSRECVCAFVLGAGRQGDGGGGLCDDAPLVEESSLACALLPSAKNKRRGTPRKFLQCGAAPKAKVTPALRRLRPPARRGIPRRRGLQRHLDAQKRLGKEPGEERQQLRHIQLRRGAAQRRQHNPILMRDARAGAHEHAPRVSSQRCSARR